MKKKNKTKKKSKKRLIIILSVVGLIVVGVIVGLLIYFLNAPKMSTEWGETYYTYLDDIRSKYHNKQDIKASGFSNDIESYNIKFIDAGLKEPVMVSEYKKDNEEYLNVYSIDKEGKVTTNIYNTPTKLKLLYNINQKKYIWYIYNKSDSISYYTPLSVAADKSKESNDNLVSYDDSPHTDQYNTKNPNSYTTYSIVEHDTYPNDDIRSVITDFDQNFIEIDKDIKDTSFDLDKENGFADEMNKLVDSYKKTSKLIDKSDKKKVEETIKNVEDKKIEFTKKQEELRIDSSNLQSKLGEHLKWFSAAYLGSYYGFNKIYKYTDVTGKVKVPNTPEGYMTYELSGSTSIADMKNTILKYVNTATFNKLNSDNYNGMFHDLYDYNGKVYLVEGGIGEGPYIRSQNAKFISYNNGVAKVLLEEFDGLSGMKNTEITVTFENIDGSYKITSYTTRNV